MKREDLKALELSDDVISTIMDLHGKGINTLKNFETENENLKAQLAEAGKQIESFKGMKKPEEVEAAVNEWKEKADQAKREAEEKVSKIRYENALEKELREKYKVKDPNDLIPQLKTAEIQYNEKGEFIGLAEQIKPIQESKTYLFEVSDNNPKPQFVSKTKGSDVVTDNVLQAARDAAGLK